ncbi:hypothetical protein AB0J80_37840 [Actinoplanes sp. NPDC049548]|uniref:hypothetical protein n=1 Tax=Actinoplanes sp. NPDC049548 TaxID=3155152 RepID=UPI0034418889
MDYIKGVEKTVPQMKDKGFHLQKSKDYWARADKDISRDMWGRDGRGARRSRQAAVLTR